MSLIDRMTRTMLEATTRGVHLASEVSAVAIRGAVGALPADLAEEIRRALAEPLRAILDIPGVVQETTGLPIPRQALDTANVMRTLVAPEAEDATDADLVRRRFDELMERSRQVGDDAGLPAFLEVVAQLTPDEARVLRHLGDRGPAPVIDLEAVSLVGRGTRPLLAHQTMVAERAGCVAPEEVDTYLANLVRLGIVEFREDELDHDDYQLIVGTEAYRAAAREYRDDRLWRARGRRGSLHLTAFGTRFLAVCLGREPTPAPPAERTTTARARAPMTGRTNAVPTDG